MARRRKKQKMSRRRGMGGFSQKGITSNVMPVVGLVVGALASKLVVNKLLATSTMSPMIKSAIPLAAGFVLAGMGKGGILSNIGLGMATQSGLALSSSLVPGLEGMVEADMSGIEGDIVIGENITIGEEIMGIEGSDSIEGDEQFN